MRITKLLTLILLLLLTSSLSVRAVSPTQMEIDLSVEPGDVLFDLTNVKPGDSISRRLTVLNNGNQNFNYVIKNTFISGSEKFYNQLLLKIEDSQKNIIFEGHLKDFKQNQISKLNSKESDELLFLIKIPMELGNEYQGLNCEFLFKIYVEGTLGGVLPVSGGDLPNTATGIFNLLAIGAGLFVGGLTILSFLKKKQQDMKVT